MSHLRDGPGPDARRPGRHGCSGADLAAWPLARPLEDLELTEQASAAISRDLRFHAGVRVGVIPEPSLHGLWYGLELRSLCGLMTLGLTASHRPETPVPDVMLSLALLDK